jgi:lipopolysaccharide export system protein LptA
MRYISLIFTLLFINSLYAEAPANPSNLVDKDFAEKETVVTANKLLLLSEARKFTYTGKVKVVQGDLTLFSDKLDGNYSEENKIEQMIAIDNVIIEKGVEIKAKGSKAVFTEKNKTMVLTGNPEILQGKNILTADKITIFLEENRSIAEGQVFVKVIDTEQDS